ncbi:54S ribosomal protein L24, mitochondrial [Abrus precatorius]|uniref:Large ribosomal subunit protein bL28m n=1 Tax=Abrus precatorius TaxID=3816 RepID=A0A8B8KQ08_ABRPR|nr:54S ribosomal protein L24, mitochondrial [Abrus precatorius]XP_027345394.1 54S ribosomal protein L24, mitochondrial [Abrus precatorius]
MAFRGKEMMKKVLKKVGEKGLGPKEKESLEKCIPRSKVVMNRAKRGLFAGRHIQFGNSVSEDGGNKTRRTWKPNIQEKRLFSYILDRHIRVKVTTHALRCIDKAGGIDEYLLKTPYHKMDTEMGLLWKAKIENLYEELGKKEVVFFSPEDEAKFEQDFKDLKLSEREARKEFRRKMYAGISKHKVIAVEHKDSQSIDEGGNKVEEGISHDSSERLVPVSYVLAADKLKVGTIVSN